MSYTTQGYEAMASYEIRSTTTSSPSTSSSYVLPSIPSYDGFGSNEYIAWEIEIDNIFAQHCMCERKKLQAASGTLVGCALNWWQTMNLSSHDQLPKTWNDMKILLREKFASQSHATVSMDDVRPLEEEPTVVSSLVTNMLQVLEKN
ncbi:hypothetical protein ACP70R_000216 [Stipagrostis hirtigluma subsp. patula]